VPPCTCTERGAGLSPTEPREPDSPCSGPEPGFFEVSLTHSIQDRRASGSDLHHLGQGSGAEQRQWLHLDGAKLVS
jgi:hypothetical protein